MRWIRFGSMALMATGCLRDVPRGPDLGDCAVVPDGVYSWGDIGIGTCLAGPADVRFIERDGVTLLAVTNADPYRNFSSGSVLLIDYDSVDLTAPFNYLDQLDAWSLPLFDDDDGDGIGSNAYLGQIGVLPADQLLVPSRYTEDGTAKPSAQSELRAGLDHAYVIDIADLATFGQQVPREIRLRDDPMPVVVDEQAGLVYVTNLTDHSLSVLTSDPVEKVDVAPGATIGPRTFSDLGDDSFAELVETQVFLPRETPDDAWTLTYIEGTTRLYLSTLDGLQRFESGGDAFREVGFGAELDPPGSDNYAFDPFLYETTPYEDSAPLPYAVFAEVVLPEEGPTGAGIRRAQPDGYSATGWLFEAEPLLVGSADGFDRVLGGPSLGVLEGISTLFYDGREVIDGPACIYTASSDDGATYRRDTGPFIGSLACGDGLISTSFDEVAQPFFAYDPVAGRYRIWFSARAGDVWSIALVESDDGVVWTEPREIYAEPGTSVGGPAVRYTNGQYVMYAARETPEGWDTIRATAPDGARFALDGVVAESTDAPELGRPMRPGLLTSTAGFWRIEGRDYGLAELPGVSGAGIINVLEGFGISVGHGHEASNTVVPNGWAAQGLVPGSSATVGGIPTLFATATGAAGLDHVVALQQSGSGWAVVEPFDAIDRALATAGRQASSPVVVEDAEGFVMFYGHTVNGVTRIRRATSVDGLQWVPETRDLLTTDDDWDAQTQLPHSVEVGADGVTLWYAGDNSSRFLIGAATSPTLRGTFAPSAGEFDPWQFATGTPGSFDDSGVKDPLVLTIDGVRRLYYAGFDGSAWHLGYAEDAGDGTFERRIGVDELSLPAMTALSGTFSGLGVQSPVLWRTDSDRYDMLYAGNDDFALRLGAAMLDPSTPEAIFPDGRQPTSGDTLTFETTRGGGGVSVIELGQSVDAFTTDGVGVASATLDEARGMLYVTSKLNAGIIVIDVRDDSSGSFVDANYLDIETVVRPLGASAGMGFTQTHLSSSRGLLFATARSPDGLWVFDIDDIVDDDTKDDLYAAEVAVLPLPDMGEDAGERTAAFIGGAGMALTADERTLLVTHFRDNSLLAFDLDMGAFGELVGYAPYLGENPHVVRIAPDGLTAVVANYVGDVSGEFASSTLVVIDLDPSSPTYLEPLTWIGNL